VQQVLSSKVSIFVDHAEIFRDGEAFCERGREHTQVCDRTSEQNNEASTKKIK